MEKRSMRIVMSYDVNGSLTECLRLALEMNSETGMVPREIKVEESGIKLSFDADDAGRVVNGEMEEMEYMKLHLIE